MYVYVCICMDLYGFVWICMCMYVYVWISMDFYGSVWICMDLHVYVYVFVNNVYIDIYHYISIFKIFIIFIFIHIYIYICSIYVVLCRIT